MESPVTFKNLTESNAESFYRKLRESFGVGYKYATENGHNESTVMQVYAFASYPMSAPFYYILCHMGVRVSQKDSDMISYFESRDKRDKGIRTRVKPGKFLRKVLPWLSDSIVEQFVNDWKESTKIREYDLIHSTDESDFIAAYTGEQIRGTNPDYNMSNTFRICSLSDSCMGNREFSSLPKHPAAAYASGDFSILYTKEKETGKIGARVVIGNNSGNRIYSQCNSASRAILAWLAENNINPRSNWDGLSFQVIPCSYGYVMPYVDGYSDFSFDGDSITIGGDLDHSSTSGYAEFKESQYCDHCEESVYCDSDDMEQALDQSENIISVCPTCRRRHYTYSSLQQIWIHDSIAYSVNDDVATQDWLDSNGYVYTVDSEYEEESECLLYNGDWFPHYHCDVVLFEGEYYHEDSDELIEAQEVKAKEDEAYEVKKESSFQWVKKITRKYRGQEITPYLEYKETTERILRLNFQLDSNDIPQRLPELDLGLVDITSDNCD